MIIDLGVESLGALGVLGQYIPGPTQGGGRGFDAGPDQGNDFVSQLLRRQTRFCIVGTDEARE